MVDYVQLAVIPLDCNISVHIPHNLFLYISFCTEKENLFNNESFLGWETFLLFSWSQWMMQQYYCKENSDGSHSNGLKS